MKYLAILASIIIALTSCNKTIPEPEELPDTLRGIFGNIALYNKFGEEEFSLQGIKLSAHCVDTTDTDSVGNPTGIYDTTMLAVTNDLGAWEFRKCPRGYYTITISKDGYGDNVIYKQWYDTTKADSLADMFLAQQISAEIKINTLLYNQSVININRTITFTEPYINDYKLTTWYFFDTTAQVSKSKYLYAYLAGASLGNAGDAHTLTVQKPIDKLYENGFSEGDSVYVKAYCDNLYYSKYQTGLNSWIYPNASVSSQVHSFVITPELTED